MSLYETGIRPLVDEYLALQSAKRRDYGNYWSASSAGYCMRLNILKRLEVPPVPEIAEDRERTIRVFEAGHIFHEFMQRITKANGLSIASEDTLQDEKLMVRGHFDDLIEFKLDESGEIARGTEPRGKHYILYDYKTANSQAFNYKKPLIGDYHKMQLGTYLYMIKSSGKYPPVSEGRILTISKDDLRMREQQLKFTPDIEKEVVAYWTTLNGYWSKQMLPRCTCLEHDGGFMGKRSKKGKVYGDYFFNDKPCNLEWVVKHKDLLEGWKVKEN
jgi:hypothetical protein